MNTTARDSTPAFFGTWVVRAAFVLAVFGWGVGFYGPPIYLHAVIERTGWSLTLVSAAVTLHYLAGVIVVANLPRLFARFGLPLTIAVGAAVTGLGVLGWAVAAQPWQLFVAALCSGMGWVTMGAVTVNAVISPWHVRTRPVALAKAYNGASIGGVLFSPLWVALIAALGFAAAAITVAVLMFGVMVLLGRHVFAKTPRSLGQQPDGAALAAAAPQGERPAHAALPGAALWRHRSFRTLAIGMAIGLFAQIGLLAHLFSLLVPTLGAQTAGLVMGAATACAIGGRSLAARLLAYVPERRQVAAAAYALQALGTLLLLLAGADQVVLLLLGVALFGSGIGNATSLPPLIAQSDFAPAEVPRVVALIVAIGQGTYAFAPAIFGIVLSLSGLGSVPFFALALGLQLVAGVALLAGVRRP